MARPAIQSVRLSRTERDVVELLAGRAGVSIAEIMRSAVLAAADVALGDSAPATSARTQKLRNEVLRLAPEHRAILERARVPI